MCSSGIATKSVSSKNQNAGIERLQEAKALQLYLAQILKTTQYRSNLSLF